MRLVAVRQVRLMRGRQHFSRLVKLGGFAVVPQRPGNGLTWDAKAVEKYRIE